MYCSKCFTRKGFYQVGELKTDSLKVIEENRVWLSTWAEIICTTCKQVVRQLPLSNTFTVGGSDEYRDRPCGGGKCNSPEPLVSISRYEVSVERTTKFFGIVVHRYLRIQLWLEQACKCKKWRWPDTVYFIATEENIDSWTEAPPPTEQQRANWVEAQKVNQKHADYLAPYKELILFMKVETVSRESVSYDGSFNIYAHRSRRCPILKATGADEYVGSEVEEVSIKDDRFVSKRGAVYSGRLCAKCVESELDS